MSLPIRTQSAKRRLDDLIDRFARPLTTSRQPFWRLIHAVRASSQLLVPCMERGRIDRQTVERVLRACVRMADCSISWHRPPEFWSAPDASQYVQFQSLVGHLFDKYPVPRFLSRVWMSEGDVSWELAMYLHLAAGKSIRQFPLPVPFRLSKRAAVFFMQAPEDFHPIAAMRWAHVRSLGGDNRLARLLASRTILVAPSRHEAFWESVIRFLIQNAPLFAEEIVAIVHFIHNQRFQPAELVWGPGAGPEPLQPEFSLCGRSLMSLRRHMTNWQTELLEQLPPLGSSTRGWKRSEIGAFRCVEDDQLWTIDELLTDRELRVEGGIMQHCVATYIPACARRRTSIWSLKLQQGERRRRIVTLEVRPRTKTIWQMKGKRNSPPTEKAREMIERWAVQEGLQIHELANV